VPYRPQRRHLALISTGDKYAIASRGRWSAEGASIWRLKNHIDRRWMRMYRDLDRMTGMGSPRIGNGAAIPEMRCGGCGAKVGGELLGRVLRRIRPPRRADVVVGLDPADDAAVVAIAGNQLLVQSVDFFRAFIDDPYLFGRIAANHCLGDLYAMGATPQTALAIVTLIYGPDAKLEADLLQLLTGATETLTEAGAVLVGGHTGEGAELAFGLTVNGVVAPDQLWRKSGMRVGDRLVLTKPLGTGTLFAADMRAKARGDWIDAALATMLTSNRTAADAFRRHDVTACTDVTGFGLVGHLLEMLRASSVDAEISLAAVPALDGALDLLGRGIASSLAPQNLALSAAVDVGGAPAADPRIALLYDPQTAGGLLGSVPAKSVDACLAELRSDGATQAVCIGRVTGPATGAPRIALAP
jgi:selenide,water dikinase